MNKIYSFKYTDIIITNDNGVYIKFSLMKTKHSRFSANRHAR